MSWTQFANLISSDDHDLDAWRAAIRGNPNTPRTALKVALMHFIKNGDMVAIEDFSNFVIDLILSCNTDASESKAALEKAVEALTDAIPLLRKAVNARAMAEAAIRKAAAGEVKE